MANVGDLFVNFKVRTEGLENGLGALNGFVSKSKRDLNSMNGAVDALSATLAKLGIDPSFVMQMRDIIRIGTKDLPKVVEGVAALQRQTAALGGVNVAAPIAAAAATAPAAAPAAAAADLPAIDLAPIEGMAKAIRSAREQATGEIEMLGQAIQKSPILTLGDQVKVQASRAASSFSPAAAGMADAIALGSSRIEESVTAAAVVTQQRGGAITKALVSIRSAASDLPARMAAVGASITQSIGTASTAASSGFSRLAEGIRALPGRVATIGPAIAGSIGKIPAVVGSAGTSIKGAMLAIDASLTRTAGVAVSAGRAIGAGLYAALGPIGLILAAGAALYAVIESFVSAAEARVAESNARIEANMERTKAVIERTMAAVESINKETASARSVGAGTQADIEGLERLLNARADQVELIEQEIAAERELRDEVAANAKAQKSLADAATARSKAEADLAKARDMLATRNAQVDAGEIDESLANEAAANVANMQDIVSAMKAQEEAAKSLAGAAANNLALEERRVDLAQQLADKRQVEAEQAKAAQAVADAIRGFDDERLKITMQAADFEDMILQRRLAQAGVTDPAAIARVQAARDAAEVAKQAQTFARELQSLEEQALRMTLDKEAAERALYERKVASLDITAKQAEALMAEFDRVQELQSAEQARLEAKQITDTIAQQQRAIEEEMLVLTLGKVEAERQILEAKLRAAGISEQEIASIMAQRAEVEAMRDAIEERKKAEADITKLQSERERAEQALADAQASAREKAQSDELKRQQMTEGLSTAIGEIRIGSVSDAVDIQERIADETKKQTAELQKISKALADKQAVLV